MTRILAHLTRRLGLVTLAGALSLAGCNTLRPTPNLSHQLVATLTGTQETPPLQVAGTGSGNIVLNQGQTEAVITLTATNLSGAITGVHIHRGATGVKGPIVRTLNISGNTAQATWSSSDPSEPLTPELVTAVMANGLYFNVHTAANPDGEIRGQIARL